MSRAARPEGREQRRWALRFYVAVPQDEPAPPTSPPVTFYWRPGCGFCTRLRFGLRDADVEVEERNIWDDPAAAAVVRAAAGGNETVPTVVVGDVALVNPSVHAVLELLGRRDG